MECAVCIAIGIELGHNIECVSKQDTRCHIEWWPIQIKECIETWIHFTSQSNIVIRQLIKNSKIYEY